MTAIPARRRRATVIGFAAAVVGLGAALGLGVVGAATLADSTAGQVASDGQRPVGAARLPFTSTALFGVIDDEGRLVTAVVAVLGRDGSGGSLVQVPVSADPAVGLAEDLTSLDAVYAVDGPLEFTRAAERLTGLSFDVIEVADATRIAGLIAPLGQLEVQVPTAIRDASSGEVWEAGGLRLDTTEAVQLLTASETSVPTSGYEPVRSIVWAAVADRVGAGIDPAEPVPALSPSSVPLTSDEFVGRLFAGPVGFRALDFRRLTPDVVAVRIGDDYRDAFGEGVLVDVVAVDRADMLLVFGAIAPGRLGAPLDAPTFRIVNPLGPDDTAALGSTPVDVTEAVINVMIYTKVNVVSVLHPTDGSAAPDVTTVRVADPALLEAVVPTYEPVLGALEVAVAADPIEGVDVEIVLGRSYLDFRASAPEPPDTGTTDPTDEDDS